MKKLRVLAVGAHPDDLEILCGGTLAKYSKLGHTVIMAHLLNGDKGHYNMDPQEIAKIREKEAKNAGEVIKAKVFTLDISDGYLFSNPETREKVVDLIRMTQPDVILTHSPLDYIADHVTTSRIVCDASYYSIVPLFKTTVKSFEKVPPVFFMDTLSGINFMPTEYVDITNTFKIKKEMLKQHKSQLTFLKKHHKTDMLKNIELVSMFRGQQCNVKYAECFCQYGGWGRTTTKRFLP